MMNTTATADALCLPGELLDAILDCLTHDEDDNALAALASCILVSRAFRLRAMYILIARLEFSLSYGADHVAKALQLFGMLQDAPELCALPRSVILDWSECEGPTMFMSRALDVLPKLQNVKQLTLSNLDLADAPLPCWDESLKIEQLTLEECSMSTAHLDTLLASFPHLRKLELLNTHVSSISSASSSSSDLSAVAEPTPVAPLPISACALSLCLPDPATSMEVLHWALAHRASFALSRLAIAPAAVPAALRDAFLAVFGDEPTALSLGLAESQFTADDEAATLRGCTAVTTLDVLAPSLPRALVLFRSVRLAPPPRVATLAIHVGSDERPTADDLKALRDALSTWTGVKHVLVDNAPVALDAEEEAAEKTAPTFGLGDSEDEDELNTLLIGPPIDDDDCDDETVGAPTPNLLLAPPEPYRADDADSDADIEQAYAPPFALGVSSARPSSPSDESDAESDLFDADTASESELDTPHDSDVELPDDVTPRKPRRNAYAPPFALGVSVARPEEDSEDER